MKNIKVISYLFIAFILTIFVGCQNEMSTNPQAGETQHSSLAKVSKGGTIWADCQLFRTVGTPAHFKAGKGNFDQLYTGSFKDNVGAISESKPGDQDFNGGRWHVNSLKAEVDPAKYSEACSVEDLDLNDFESSDTYFECPLLPTK